MGDATEAIVLARLVQAFPEAEVLVPFGENSRYDLVLERDSVFTRIQCKTGRLRNGSIWFPTCSTTFHNSRPGGAKPYISDYRGSADVFGIYCPELDKVYLVPVDDVGTRDGCIRVEPTRNNQARKIRWAGQYELDAGLAQSVEHSICNRKAVGSIPTPGSNPLEHHRHPRLFRP